jgi:hypothetical protein
VPGQWICYEFAPRRVAVSAYSIGASHLGVVPLSWRIEGSNNGDDWVMMDVQQDLECNADVLTMVRLQGSHDFFAFVRLLQTVNSSNGDNRLALRAFELFGMIEDRQ